MLRYGMIILLILIVFICSCGTQGPMNPSSKGIFVGEWEETFPWIEETYIFIPDFGLEYEVEYRTARLQLSQDQFILKISQPFHEITMTRGTLKAEAAIDTIYTGTYEAKLGIITMYIDGYDKPKEYKYTVNGDELVISEAVKRNPNGVFVVTIGGSFLWHYSWFKHYGTFRRVE